MSRQGIVVAIVVGSLVAALAVLVWRENERRYAALAITGCFGDSAQSPLGASRCFGDSAQSPLGASQECNGAKRLCRDSPPLLDWRHYCD